MKLRMTKGVGIALAIAASCTVLGLVMAPGWWAFAAFSAWWGFVLAMGGTGNASDRLHVVAISSSDNSSTAKSIQETDELLSNPTHSHLPYNIWHRTSS